VDRALWAYDGNDWQNLGTAPAAQEQRYHAALAYDEERHVLVLFGGQTPNGGTPLADTWEFSGTGWTERFPAHAPTARFAATMVYDRGLHRVVLHGGNPLGLGGTDGVTWTWNGTDWAPSNSPTTPGPRASAGGTYDDNLGCTVLFGGSTPYGAASDTWALCSGVWAQLYPALSPPPGAPFGIFYQGIHQRVLLIGADHRTDRDNYSLRWVSGWPDEQCWSQADDDHDGLVATEDPDCQLVPVEVCDSGQDDDGDGQVDCADADCVGRSCDAGLGRCEGGLCAHAVCGDGYVDLDRGEICDDGNVVSGDGCESDCTLTP
jgi:cysteine-rich repeat protein